MFAHGITVLYNKESIILTLGVFSPMQSLQFDQSQLAAVTQENEGLRKQVEQMEAEAKKWVMWSHSDDLAHDAPFCSHLVFINRNKG